MAKAKDTEKKDDIVTPKGEREARWDAFLKKAREVNPERFDAQKANHEFDKIPEDFL